MITYPESGFAINETPSFVIPMKPRLPRQQRAAIAAANAPQHQYNQAVMALRQKAVELTLQAMENTAIHDTAQFERLLANADAFNTAAVWLASQSNHEGAHA
jgi:hypothetical protein